MSNQDSWSIGGYAPFAYTVTPWTTLFPKLGKYSQYPSLNSLYIAKLYAYYLTRLHFSQYLSFLKDVGAEICENDNIIDDVRFYTDACNKLYQTITDKITHTRGRIDSDSYADIVRKFESNLINSKTFASKAVYSSFFHNYWFFWNSAYGLIMIDVHSDAYYVDKPEILLKGVPENPFTLLPMLEDSARRYPVITRDGCLRLATYYPTYSQDYQYLLPRGWVAHPMPKFKFDDIKLYMKSDNDNYHYITVNDDERSHYYFVGLSDVPDDYPGKILGLPMLYKLPFDDLAAFADPKL